MGQSQTSLTAVPSTLAAPQCMEDRPILASGRRAPKVLWHLPDGSPFLKKNRVTERLWELSSRNLAELDLFSGFPPAMEWETHCSNL